MYMNIECFLNGTKFVWFNIIMPFIVRTFILEGLTGKLKKFY